MSAEVGFVALTFLEGKEANCGFHQGWNNADTFLIPSSSAPTISSWSPLPSFSTASQTNYPPPPLSLFFPLLTYVFVSLRPPYELRKYWENERDRRIKSRGSKFWRGNRKWDRSRDAKACIKEKALGGGRKRYRKEVRNGSQKVQKDVQQMVNPMLR